MNARTGERVDGASLALFRIGFGLVMLAEVVRYLAHGWVTTLFETPNFLFGWSFFSIPAWGGRGMHAHFVVLGIAAACVSLGFCYRVAAVVLWLGFSYVLLLDSSHTLELNHLYLMAIFAGMLAFMPADAVWSLDAKRRTAKREMSSTGSVPRWCVDLLRAQMLIVYVFAGLAKCQSDWLGGHPMRELLNAHGITSLPLALVLSYGGLIFDLAVGPMLLLRRARIFALALAVAFHATNACLFSIGVFPWLAVLSTTMFLSPDWPRRMLHLRTLQFDPVGRPLGVGGAAIVFFLAVQILLPLRSFLFAGDPGWTENGNFFAWRLMIYEKLPGPLSVSVFDPVTMRSSLYDPMSELTPLQIRSMAIRPELLRLYAHHVADVETPILGARPEVRIDVAVALNGRPMAQLVDPERDLAAEPFGFETYNWIRPRP